LRRVSRGRPLPEDLRTAIKPDRRTVVGREATKFRADLVRHCKDKPSVTERALIDLAVQLRLRVMMMDYRFLQQGEQSPNDAAIYLAWVNTLSRVVRALGLKASDARDRDAKTPSLAEIINGTSTSPRHR